MKKEELFNDDFLKQFKSGDELNGFLKELQKRGIEKMLEGELDGHLDYGRHQRSSNANKRNGHSKKKVRTSFGESEVFTSTISRITEKVADDIVAWQNRPLEPVYLIVWMDGIVFKVRESSEVINRPCTWSWACEGTERRKCWAYGWAKTSRPPSGCRCSPTSRRPAAPRTSRSPPSTT